MPRESSFVELGLAPEARLGGKDMHGCPKHAGGRARRGLERLSLSRLFLEPSALWGASEISALQTTPESTSEASLQLISVLT